MRKTSLFRKIYLSFVTLIVALSLLINAAYAFIEIPKLRHQAFNSLQQSQQNFVSLLDAELEDMHNTAVTIAYSNLLNESYKAYAEDPDGIPYNTVADMLTLILGPIRTVDQVTIYTLDGSSFSTGLINQKSFTDLTSLAWYQTMNEADMNTWVYFSGMDTSLSKYKTDRSSKYFLTSVLALRDNFNNKYAYVEIKKSCGSLLSALEAYESIYGEAFFLFGMDGSILFAGNDEATDLSDRLSGKHFPLELRERKGLNTHYTFSATSANADFIIATSIDDRQLLSSIIQNITTNLLISLILIVLSLLTAYLLSRSITKPILGLQETLDGYSLDNIRDRSLLETDIIELEVFFNTFNQLQSQLVKNMNERILLMQQKTQSQMIALRSQMNPHFMYNSLASIQSMAEENMNDSIIDMCQLMASILRYISSDEADLVEIRDELEHTEAFLTYMDIRHHGNLTFEINVDEAVKSNYTAKLSIQQFVENSIKFMSASKLPPYFVSVSGELVDKNYYIRITDNGNGFDEDVLAGIFSQIETIKANNLLPQLEINGMGILNVYIRLWNIYKDALIFDIVNLPEGGCCVTIGGPYDQ